MTTPTTFSELVNFFLGIVNQLIPLVFGVVFVYLVWKVLDAWVFRAGDENARTEGKQTVLVAVLVLVVMVSAWGIVALLRRSLFGG